MRFLFRIKSKGYMAEIEEEISDKDVFEFIKELIAFIETNEDFFSSEDLRINEGHLKQKLQQSIIGVKQEFPKKEEEKEILSNEILKLSSDFKVDPELLLHIYDFDSEGDIPPLTIDLKMDTRVEKQRVATILLLHANYVLNQESNLSSFKLTQLLEKSSIDPTEPNKAFRGDFSKYIRCKGKTYHITSAGRVKAKEILKELIKKQV